MGVIHLGVLSYTVDISELDIFKQKIFNTEFKYEQNLFWVITLRK